MYRLFSTFVCILSLASVVISKCHNSFKFDSSFTPDGRNLVWPHPSVMETQASVGSYIPKNIIATRMQIHKGEVFIAMPRLKPGVPFTLGIMSLNKRTSEAITPFPSFSIQKEGNCQALQNAVDIFVDTRNILWVLDSGIVNILTRPVRRCAPKVVAIDIKNGKTIRVIDLTDSVLNISDLHYMVVDHTAEGKIFLYITDAPTRSIIVHDVIAGTGYRAHLPKDVCSTGSPRDELYIALVRKKDRTSVLYFTYHNSNSIFSIEASRLRNVGMDRSVTEEGSKKNKIIILGTDGGSTIFFRDEGNPDIYKWDVNTPFCNENHLLLQKGDECRLSTHVVPGTRNTIWTLESNFLDYVSNTVPRSGPSMSIRPIVNKMR